MIGPLSLHAKRGLISIITQINFSQRIISFAT